MKTRTLLFTGIGIIAVAGAFAGHKYYGRIKHRLFGEEKVTLAKADDLYNEDEKLFKRGRRDKDEVCLTIDDGPHSSLHRILPILKKYNARATFFMVGFRIASSPKLVQEVLKDGFEIGNHTQTHPRLDTLPADQVRKELAACEASFEKASGGAKMTLFRPPGMRFTPELFSVIREFGYTTVGWNTGAKDFILKTGGPNVTINEGHIAESVLKNVKPGSIILLHDSDDTANELPAILEGLQKKGLVVKDVTQMLADLPKPVIVPTNAVGR